MRKLFLALVVSMAALGCASVSVDEPSVCDSKSLTQLPSIPSGVTVPSGIKVPPVAFSQQVDLSDTLSKINSVADTVSVSVNELSLSNNSGDFSWLSYVEVDMQSPSLPMLVLIKYNMQSDNQSASTIPFAIQVDSNTLYKYLSKGPVTLNFTLSGNTPAQVPHLSGNICLSASASVTKSL